MQTLPGTGYRFRLVTTDTSWTGSANTTDLTLSGMMLQNFVVLEATNTKFTIGLLPPVQDYGYAVNQDRGFIGLAKKEVDQLVEIVKANLLGE